MVTSVSAVGLLLRVPRSYLHEDAVVLQSITTLQEIWFCKH